MVTASQVLPRPVTEDLKALGLALRRARVARRESQAALGRRLGVSERTVRAVEAGDPGVAMGTVVALLWAVGFGGIGAELDRRVAQQAQRPARIRARAKALDDF